MKRTLFYNLLAIALSFFATGATAQAQQGAAQKILSQAAKEGKYTFLLFHKQDDAATQNMIGELQKGLEKYRDNAVAASSQVGALTEDALVKKYGVARAPMPVTVVVAPNGAVTGMFPQRITAEAIGNAFVTPTMLVVMKSLQEGKMVLVTANGAGATTAPSAVQQFKDDAHFKDRVVTTELSTTDPNELKFLAQMKIQPNSKETQLVLIAPPGVRVGNFPATATKEQIAAELAKAGKCCDDPNCKHHQSAQGPANAPR